VGKFSPQLPNNCAVTTMPPMQVTVRLLPRPRLGFTTLSALLGAAGALAIIAYPSRALATPLAQAAPSGKSVAAASQKEMSSARARAQNSIFQPKENSSALESADKSATSSELVVDAVVASVNGKPITLADVATRLGSSAPLSLSALSSNPQAKQTLEQMIFEHLIEEEATNRKIRVTDPEIDGYIEEVAKKNKMSRDQFETALRAHAQRVDVYRDQVKADILRSRLIAQLMQQGAAVNDEDISQYLKEHPALTRAGSKVKLSQIVVSNSARTQEEALARATEARTLIEEGRPFAKVAEAYSEGAEAAEGGSLGVVAEEELSPKVFEALLSVKEGEVTPLVELPDGYRLFLVERRYLEKEKEVDESILSEVRKALTEKKLQERVQTFFTTDLMKLHTIDRKV
jgi:peptidyl-prolyl cis-trans isomerase SurA